MNWKKSVGIGLGVVMIAAAAGYFYIPRAVHNFFYPKAAPMPPVVGDSTSVILKKLEGVLKNKAPHVLEQLQPGLSDQQIAALEQKAGVQLPEDIKALYRWHNGCQSNDVEVSVIIPGHRFLPLDEVFESTTILSNQVSQGSTVQKIAASVLISHRKSWITLFDDGAGDGYFFDPQRKPEEGALFFNSPEDSSYVFFPSMRNLLAGVVKCYETDAFKWKDDPSHPRVDEDYVRAETVWDEFGTHNSR